MISLGGNGLLPYTSELLQFNAALDAAQPDPAVAGLEELPWQARYVELLLDEAALAQQTSMRVMPEMLHFSVAGTSRLNVVTKKMKVANLIRRLEEGHDIVNPWKPREAAFEEGLEVLKQQRLLSIQKEISTRVQHLLLIEETFQRQATVRGDTKRLQSVKDLQIKKIKAALSFWEHWKLVQTGQVDNAGSGLPTTAEPAEASAQLLNAVCRGAYPWITSERAGDAFD